MAELININISNLSTGYQNKKSVRKVSKDLNLSIRKGEVVMLMGPNGSGKSTLMHTIAGLLTPLAGEIKVNNKDISQLSNQELAQELSLVLTEKLSPANMTVRDIVELGRYPYTGYLGFLKPEDKAFIDKAIHKCRLEGMEHRLFVELSDGEKQRCLIARSLAQDTSLMLLDEPTAHLDLPSRLELILMLKELAHEQGTSMLISTHEMDLALHWADTIWLINQEGDVVSACPEDLVLGGHFEAVFGNPSLSYNYETGEFALAQKGSKPITLKGDGLARKWTHKALVRKAYEVVDNLEDNPSIPCVEVLEGKYLLRLNGAENLYTNLTDLLISLEHS